MSHILVVEDEPIIRTALRRLLERHQYQVSEAGAVHEAVENHNLDDFALIISDLRLPGEPGTELIRRAPNTPVLIMTSYASLRSAVDSMKLGAVDYIATPLNHEEMWKAVAGITEASHRSRAAAGPADPGPAADTASDNTDDTQCMGIIGASPAMLTLF